MRAMDRKPILPSDFAQTHPGLSILRLAALLAEDGGAIDDDTLDLMFVQMETRALADTPCTAMWPELERGLMAGLPSLMIRALRESGSLEIVLPEVHALFGVPQIATPHEVDLGRHLLASLDVAARDNAPLDVRFALLTMNVGKSDSPKEHLPVHYRHVERGAPRIEAIAGRFGVPASARNLALLALGECERVHRVSDVRAGPVAAMLERTGAFDDPLSFQLLMDVCTCDYLGYEGNDGSYPKARLLAEAVEACSDIGLVDDMQMARAQAIARVFGSERWSS
jgi:tRNA nucleotidyltransferase (CCA-adding enzyme)